MSYITVDNKLVLIDGKPIMTPNEPEGQEKTLDITANGTYTAEPDNGKMLTKVTANVNVPSKPEQVKSVTFTSNDTYTVEPDNGKTLSKVAVTVDVPSSGPTTLVSPSDITFYDYDGTVVEAWTLAELAAKTALPDYPTHEGLTCQGWNWTLAELKSENAKMNVGAMYITDDGKTRIHIHLEEGRTSPLLGVCPNGTVTVDWGDGTTPDTLTGTSIGTVKWTPTHNYALAGDYVIKLTVNGEMSFYGDSDIPLLLMSVIIYIETVLKGLKLVLV